MSVSPPTVETLQQEVLRLEQRLREAEALVQAIREQRVDALVVDAADGKRVFTLEGSDRPYRSLIEEMNQGALTLDASGLILYCNHRFARLVGRRREKLVATYLIDLVATADKSLVAALLRQARSGPVQDELRIVAGGRYEVPVYLSLESMPPDSGAAFGAVVTDLSEQIRHKQLVAAEELARSIFEQAADCIVVCDAERRITRCNLAARELCGRNPLRERFDRAFPLKLCRTDSEAGGEIEIPALSAVALRGETPRGVELRLERKDGSDTFLLVSFGPLRGADGRVGGFTAVLTDITSRKQDEAKLHAQAEELAEAGRRKDDFLAMLGHELRNPLAPIRNAVHVLGRVAPDEPQIRLARDIIDRQVTHMVSLVDELLDVSRITHGKMLMRKERADLAVLVRTCAEDQRPAFDRAGIAFEVIVPQAVTWATLDRTRVTQVVANLLENALKFTERGGRVELELAREDARTALLIVRDTGAGIGRDLQRYVFDAFRQGQDARGGLGLGLALVRGIVEMHGGTVEVQSAGSGKGSCFRVHLPLEPELEPMSETHLHQRALGGSHRVLVVEDHHDSAESLRMLLQVYGQEVEVRRSLEDALACLERFQPELVLCDLDLGDGLGGFEVARSLRDDPRTRPAVLVALTGFGQGEHRERSLQAGFDLYWTKPVDCEALKRVIAEL